MLSDSSRCSHHFLRRVMMLSVDHDDITNGRRRRTEARPTPGIGGLQYGGACSLGRTAERKDPHLRKNAGEPLLAGRSLIPLHQAGDLRRQRSLRSAVSYPPRLVCSMLASQMVASCTLSRRRRC